MAINNPYIPGDPYSYDLKWIVDKLKEALALYEPLHQEFVDLSGNFDALSQDFQDLKDYVNDYFNNLDLSTEVTNVINSMVNDGFFDALILQIVQDSNQIQPAVTQWLEDNVNPVGSAVTIDSTLTVQGSAADAKVVGDKFDEMEDKLNETPEIAIYSAYSSENHLGCIRSYNTDTLELNGYTPTASSAWFNEINRLNYTSSYGNAETYRIPITANMQELYLSQAYVGPTSQTSFAVTIADASYRYIAAVTKNQLLNSEIPYTFNQILTYDASGYPHFDLRMMKVKYPDAAYIYLTNGSSANPSAVVDWQISENYSFYQDLYRIEKLASAVSGATADLIVPTQLYAVVGKQFCMFYDQIVLCENLDNYAVNVNVSGLSNMEKLENYFRITPTAGQIGIHNMTIELVNKKTLDIINSTVTKLNIVADPTFTNKKVMFIGDSLTQQGVYAAEIQDVLSNNGITSVGTRVTNVTYNGVSHLIYTEGRNGWSLANYYNSAIVDGISNPFYGPNNVFDFSYYIANTGVSAPDLVVFYLGTNGVSNYESDIPKLKTMINSVKNYNSNIKILVALIPCGASQNGFGLQHLGVTAADFNYYAKKRNTAYLDNFDSNLIANVGIAAPAIFVDPDYDYPTVTQAESARNPIQVTRQNNNVHPDTPGYLHMADAIYNTLACWL